MCWGLRLLTRQSDVDFPKENHQQINERAELTTHWTCLLRPGRPGRDGLVRDEFSNKKLTHAGTV